MSASYLTIWKLFLLLVIMVMVVDVRIMEKLVMMIAGDGGGGKLRPRSDGGDRIGAGAMVAVVVDWTDCV